MKKIFIPLIICIFTLSFINIVYADEIIVDENVFFYVDNIEYTFSYETVFSWIDQLDDHMVFNESGFYITSPNQINISLDFIHNDVTNATDGTKIMSFYANTTSGTVWFQIDGFEANEEYKIYRDGTIYTTITSDITGNITFANSEWSTKYLEIFTSGGPPSLTINVIDDCIPSICGEISMTNEGDESQEYIYYYWIAPRADGEFADGDTVDSGSSSKLVASSETFTVTKYLTVNGVGDYWFKVKAYWGVEYSEASDGFTSVSCSDTTSRGGIPIEKYQIKVICVDEDHNRIPNVILMVYDDNRFISEQQTDNNGEAIINVGRYMNIRIIAKKSGYLTTEINIFVDERLITETIMIKTSGGSSTPGFELFLLFSALFIVVIGMRKRH